MGRKKRVDQLINRLAAKEERFLECEFLAPAVESGTVRVRIAGVVCELRMRATEFRGFGVFRPSSFNEAELVRPATLAERKKYLELFPVVRLILHRRVGEAWTALPAHRGDARFQIDGTVPVELVDEAQLFDVVQARFDGGSFWFDSLEGRGDPARAAYLRASLEERVDPEALKRPGLTAEERVAYALNYFEAALSEEAGRGRDDRERERGDPVARRLRDSLAHAGARFLDYLERRDSYRVRYILDGHSHVSTVSREDLTIQSAGICLSGTDREFDLESLVGVIREGRRRDEIYEEGEDEW